MNKHTNDEEQSFPQRIASIFRGYRTVETALIIGVVAIIVVLSISFFGYKLNELFTNINDHIPDVTQETEVNKPPNVTDGD